MKKNLFFVPTPAVLATACILFISPISALQKENLFNEFPLFRCENEQIRSVHRPIEQAFVTFATKNYFPLLEVAIKSVHAFSTRPVIAYGINDDIPFSQKQYPNLIKRRISVNPKYAKPPYVYFFKFCIILDSGIKQGIYIEADDIVNYKIDDLFQESAHVGQFPACPVHPDNPDNQKELMAELGVTEKTNPYLHGHIIFADACKPFLLECYQTCLTYGSSIKGNWDETVMNVLLWKYKVHDHYLPIFDPYFSAHTAYINEQPLNMNITIKTPIYCHMFHGAKNAVSAHSILDVLKKNVGKPIQVAYGKSLDEIAKLAQLKTAQK